MSAERMHAYMHSKERERREQKDGRKRGREERRKGGGRSGEEYGVGRRKSLACLVRWHLSVLQGAGEPSQCFPLSSLPAGDRLRPEPCPFPQVFLIKSLTIRRISLSLFHKMDMLFGQKRKREKLKWKNL